MAIKINIVKVKPDDNGIRLDRWFKRYYPLVSFTAIVKLIRTGQIRVSGKRAKPEIRIEEDQEIRFPDLNSLERERIEGKPQRTKKALEMLELIKQNILYKDNNILAINKPFGIPVQGGTKINLSIDDLLEDLKFESQYKPKLVHRLDKDTTGVLLLARNNKSAARLSELIRFRKVTKKYLALLSGVPDPLIGKIDIPLKKESEEGESFEKVVHNKKGIKAITEYKVLDYAFETAALVEMNLITGRTHQLRAHSALINCPILGDTKYNTKKNNFQIEQKLYLHSYITELTYDGKKIVIKAPVPSYFKEALRTFGINLPK